ncbi:CDP-alcohol phosphatidyltransferase family protein [Caulobacter sp. S45]|uniref:CDP-alcohol phosphatidyltransferase family protein n=1 Tax=Caulobacter sp. S45 TaxID=1641861 RepID=UPI00131C8DF1|nr:CDP-alcohol phosphatidyltransferase family protein [Caulobacter sp. S45]
MLASSARGQSRPLPGVILAGTSLTLLKPWLKSAVRPAARTLVAAGITANQVTLMSLAGSLAVAWIVAGGSSNRAMYLLLPLWLGLRTVLAALDGTMAIEFGQKSRLGGALNEIGDLVSDVALIATFAAVAPMNPGLIMLVAALAAGVEGVGLLGHLVGKTRRLEGPFGKCDRAIAYSGLAVWIALGAPVPQMADPICWMFAGLSAVTLSNRGLEALDAHAASPR